MPTSSLGNIGVTLLMWRRTVPNRYCTASSQQVPSSLKYYLTPTSSLVNIAVSWLMGCRWVQMPFYWTYSVTSGMNSNSTAYFYAMSNSFKYFTTLRNFSSFFFYFGTFLHIHCPWGQLLFYGVYTSLDGLRRLSTCTNHGSWDIYDKYSFKKCTFMQCQIVSNISQRWEIFRPFFFYFGVFLHIHCPWGQLLFYGMYASLDGYADFLHLQIKRWILMLNNLFQNNIFVITIAILHFNNFLRSIHISVWLRWLPTCTNHGSWDIYDKYSF